MKEACNKKVILNVARKLDEEPELVRSIFSNVCLYVRNTIKAGGYESVEIPNFGKFKAKLKYAQILATKSLYTKPRKYATDLNADGGLSGDPDSVGDDSSGVQEVGNTG